jgi:hypothetical protein
MEPLEAFACICAKTIHYGSGMWYISRFSDVVTRCS